MGRMNGGGIQYRFSASSAASLCDLCGKKLLLCASPVAILYEVGFCKLTCHARGVNSWAG
jgi:hypothetical protein